MPYSPTMSSTSEPDHDAVLEFLRDLGATDEQIAEAAASDMPSRHALDVVLAQVFPLSARDVAERAGVSLADVIDTLGRMGFRVDDPDAKSFGEADVELMNVSRLIGHGLSHVFASAIGRIADAAVAAYVTEIDPRLSPAPTSREASGGGGGLKVLFENFRIRFGYAPSANDELSIARSNAAAAELAIRAAGSLGSSFLHALREAVAWQRAAQTGVSERGLHRLAVGFVDLTGFTALSREMTVDALTDLVLDFESTAFNLATDAGGRVIKHIGDEVMFVALDAESGAKIAAGIVESFAHEGLQPRGGVAYGEVLAVHGDYYGSVVNLASRLTDIAIPGEVLVDAATAASVDESGGLVESAGRRMLKGFDDPVMVFSYVTGDATIADAAKNHPAGG
jgi:class 3 adenylate cyclase